MAESKAKKTTAKKSTAKKKTAKSKDSKHADIGIDVAQPKKTCDDQFCPFHGTLSVRGQILEGVVVSDRMQNSAVVQREHLRKIPKYERFEKRTNKYMAHNPPCLEAMVGDHVKIMECRPLSKNISYVIIENVERR